MTLCIWINRWHSLSRNCKFGKLGKASIDISSSVGFDSQSSKSSVGVCWFPRFDEGRDWSIESNCFDITLVHRPYKKFFEWFRVGEAFRCLAGGRVGDVSGGSDKGSGKERDPIIWWWLIEETFDYMLVKVNREKSRPIYRWGRRRGGRGTLGTLKNRATIVGKFKGRRLIKISATISTMTQIMQNANQEYCSLEKKDPNWQLVAPPARPTSAKSRNLRFWKPTK